MIVANLATYPPRRDSLLRVVDAIAPQVDRMNVVLNQYQTVPEELTGLANVHPVIPPEDTKDVGKFFPDCSTADYVFLVDDDIVFPADYVVSTIDRFNALGPSGYIASYHASIYLRPRLKPKWSSIRDRLTYRRYPANFRRVFTFYKALEAPVVVDQIASGVAVLRGRDMPGYAFMRDSQKFVDVRLATWVHQQGLTPVVLPRDAEWLQPIRYEETIYEGFTQMNPPHVNAEILSFAYKMPHTGEIL